MLLFTALSAVPCSKCCYLQHFRPSQWGGETKKKENGRKREFATDPRSKRAQEKNTPFGHTPHSDIQEHTKVSETKKCIRNILFTHRHIYIHIIGVRGLPERRIFFLGAFGRGFVANFRFRRDPTRPGPARPAKTTPALPH